MKKQVVFYIVFAFLLLPMVIAYKVNLICPATVEPESEVSCGVDLVLNDAEISAGGVQGFGADFLLGSDVYDFSPASMTFLHNDGITYSSDSDNFVESVNYDSTLPNQLHVDVVESSRAFTPAESFARLTFTAPAVEGDLLFFITPVDFGYFDGTNDFLQDCAEASCSGSASCDNILVQCTETDSLSPVRVVVEEAKACILGDYDGSGTVTSADTLAFTWHKTFGDYVEFGFASSDGCGSLEELSCAITLEEVTNYICDDGSSFENLQTTCDTGACILGDYDGSGTVTSADTLAFTWHKTFGDYVEFGFASSDGCGSLGELSCAITLEEVTNYICDDGSAFGNVQTTC